MEWAEPPVPPCSPQKQQDPIPPLALPHCPVPSWQGGWMLPAPLPVDPRPCEVSSQVWGSLQHPHLPGVWSSKKQPDAALRAAGATEFPLPRAILGSPGGTKQLPARFAQHGEEKNGALLGSRPPGRWMTQGGRHLHVACILCPSVHASSVHPFGARLLAAVGLWGGFHQEASEALIVLCVALNYFPIPTAT